MAIRGPKGPGPQAPPPSSADDASSEVDGPEGPVALPRADSSSSDAFQRGLGNRRREVTARLARDRVRRNLTVLHQAAVVITEEVARFEAEAQRILHLLAHQAYSMTALERHKKELARIRRKLDAARRQLLKSRRRLADAERGVDEIPESELAKVHEELERLEAFSTEWGRALIAVELAAKYGGDESPRRLVVRGGERDDAMAYAEGANPTTAIADLATSALRMAQTPQVPSMPKGDGLGRSLDGQQILERLVRGSDDGE